MPVLSLGHYRRHNNDGPVIDPVLIKKSQLSLVQKVTGYPDEFWFIKYGEKIHRRTCTPEDLKMGFQERYVEILVLRQNEYGELGTQGTACMFRDEEHAQKFLDGIEDYKPAKAEGK